MSTRSKSIVPNVMVLSIGMMALGFAIAYSVMSKPDPAITTIATTTTTTTTTTSAANLEAEANLDAQCNVALAVQNPRNEDAVIQVTVETATDSASTEYVVPARQLWSITLIREEPIKAVMIQEATGDSAQILGYAPDYSSCTAQPGTISDEGTNGNAG